MSSLQACVESWKPGPVTDEDSLPTGPVAALSAVLDEPEPVATAGRPLPPLWHWLYFLNWPAQQDLGADGHPAHGTFLPPIPDRQRMFAGGRCAVTEPLRLDERTERFSSLQNIAVKQGRTGELLFVTQRHEFRQGGRTCLVEEQDIVYRSGRSPGRGTTVLDESAAPALDAPWRLAVQPDPTLLFRFSALTANAHRIHYDATYARDAEGYPGLVVHGPLLALLMLELVRRDDPSRPVRSLSYRLRSPVFSGERLLVCGEPADGGARMQVASHRETQHATGEVTFA
ncbi:hypothetical protein AB0L10_44320 [Streptomyces flaveolus]|uniref:hypothetical protein n=1 Tax=Streptomyces flaveolus TaxID=67297 RepID=UPI00342EC66B